MSEANFSWKICPQHVQPAIKMRLKHASPARLTVGTAGPAPLKMPELFCGRSTAFDGCAFLRIAFWLRAVYPFNMTSTEEAIYEQGVLRPLTAPPLQEHALVRLVIHVHGDPAPGGSDLERAEWLKQSELTLLQVWSNTEDDVYSGLLTQ